MKTALPVLALVALAGLALAEDAPSLEHARELRAQCIERLTADCEGDGWGNHHERLAAAAAIASEKPALARATIMKAYDQPAPTDTRVWEREAALRAMAAVGSAVFFEPVKAALDSPQTRTAAIRALPAVAAGREDEARALLKKAAKAATADNDLGDHALAVFALAKLKDPSVAEEIARLASGKEWPDEWFRAEALAVLLERGDPAATLEPARSWAKSKDLNLRIRAADLLGRFGTKADERALEKLSSDPSELVSLPAAEGLSRLGAHKMSRLFERHAKSGSLVALEYVVDHGDAGCITMLEDRLAGENDGRRQTSVTIALLKAIDKHLSRLSPEHR